MLPGSHYAYEANRKVLLREITVFLLKMISLPVGINLAFQKKWRKRLRSKNNRLRRFRQGSAVWI
jgi:hypothetical protein